MLKTQVVALSRYYRLAVLGLTLPPLNLDECLVKQQQNHWTLRVFIEEPGHDEIDDHDDDGDGDCDCDCNDVVC